MRKEFLKWATGEKNELLDKIIDMESKFDELQEYFTINNDMDIVFALDDTLSTINYLIKLLKEKKNNG
jgi:hypothetical protein